MCPYPIGYWLLAIGYWLLAIGYWLLAIGYWLLAIGYWLTLPRPCETIVPGCVQRRAHAGRPPQRCDLPPSSRSQATEFLPATMQLLPQRFGTGQELPVRRVANRILGLDVKSTGWR